MKRFLIAIVLVVLLVTPISAYALSIAGPTYPAPGGNVWLGTGEIGGEFGPLDGHLNWSYSNFNHTAYTSLDWGLWDTTTSSLGVRLDDGVLQPLTFNGIMGGNTATWIGTANYMDPDPDQFLNTRLVLTLSGNASFVTASNVNPILAGLGAMVAINGDYTLNGIIQANYNSVWTDVNDLPQTYFAITQTRFSGGFYYEPVPESATMVLFGLGLLGFAGLSRKKIKK